MPTDPDYFSQTLSLSMALDCIPVSVLGHAAHRGNLDVLNECLANPIDWAVEETSALHCAILGHQTEAIDLLLAHGSPVSGKSAVLSYLCELPEVFLALVKDPELISRISTQDWNLLLVEAAFRNAPTTDLEFLLQHSAQVNLARDVYDGKPGRHAIHHVARHLNLESMQLLLNWKADPNKVDPLRKTPMDIVSTETLSAEKRDRQRMLELLKKDGGRFGARLSWWDSWSRSRGNVFVDVTANLGGRYFSLAGISPGNHLK